MPKLWVYFFMNLSVEFNYIPVFSRYAKNRAFSIIQDGSLQQQKQEGKHEEWKRKLKEELYSNQKGPHF